MPGEQVNSVPLSKASGAISLSVAGSHTSSTPVLAKAREPTFSVPLLIMKLFWSGTPSKAPSSISLMLLGKKIPAKAAALKQKTAARVRISVKAALRMCFIPVSSFL